MNKALIGAIRKEAFVQGYIKSREDMCQSRLTDAEALELLPAADEAYARYRKERGQP